MKCCVLNCKNDSRTIKTAEGITFHQFPNDPTLRTSWLDSLNVSEWTNKDKSYVCSKHFNLEDLYQTKSGTMKIRSGAVPFVDQDSIEDLDSPVTEKVCRICLGMNRKMYNIREHKMDVAFEHITGVSVTDEDKLPQKLCYECSHRLLSCVRFKDRSMRSQALLMEVLDHNHYISLRDVRSLGPSLSSVRSPLTYNRCNNDINVVHDGAAVKNDCKLESDGEDNVIFDDGDNLDNDQSDHEVKVENEQTQIQVEVEVKNENENENEIFLNEYTDNFDSEDDRKLSEVYKSEEKKEIKQKKKVKKKEVKRKEKVTKKRERVEDENNPATTMDIMDKYKTSNVKRRKNDGLDESLFTITTLTYEEQIAEISRRADSSMYISAPYKCTACYRGFLNVERYYSHRVRHTEAAGAYECFICKTRLKSARALRKHLTAQHTEKFSCKGCTFTTRNRGVAREHEKWHAGTKYHCPHCPSEFDKVTTYMGHIRIKHVSDCVCELCGYTFISQKGIEVHKKKKHRVDKNVELEGPYCEVCDVKFLSEEAHARHLKLSSRHSSDSDPNRIRNDSQSKGTLGSSGSRRSLEKRLDIHTADGGEPTASVTCEQCGVELRDLRLYAQHFRRAHPDKNRTKYPAMKTPCMCELCGRIFQSMALLKDHMWVHTGEKRFKCDRCDKSFTQKTNLVFHMRVHSASRPTYECPLCGKHFAFYNNRRRHMFIHTGLKPFKCDTCGKCFTTQGEQRAHLEHVHLKKPWPKRSRQRQREDTWPRQGQDD